MSAAELWDAKGPRARQPTVQLELQAQQEGLRLGQRLSSTGVPGQAPSKAVPSKSRSKQPLMMLINAAEELHRSSSHGPAGSEQPSTAATAGLAQPSDRVSELRVDPVCGQTCALWVDHWQPQGCLAVQCSSAAAHVQLKLSGLVVRGTRCLSLHRR